LPRIFAALLGAQDDVNSGVGDDWLAAHLTDLQSKGGVLNITEYQSLMFYEIQSEECSIQKEILYRKKITSQQAKIQV
jgi:hypothetical protein